MKFTGERIIPNIPEIEHGFQEHIIRYEFASQFCKNKIVLDLGCGTGYGTELLRKNKAKKVFGIDISKSAINYCKDNYPLCEFKIGNILHTKYPSDFFDVIVCFEVIEHIKEHEKVMSEIKRILKKDGILVMSTPNKLVHPNESKFHVKELDEGEFKALLQKYFKTNKLFYEYYPYNILIKKMDNLSTTCSLENYPKANRDYLIFVSTNYKKNLKINNLIREFKSKTSPYKKIDLANNVIKEKDEEIKRKNLDIDSLIRERDEKIKQKELYIENLKKDNSGLKNSISWKITKPIRVFGDLIGYDKRIKNPHKEFYNHIKESIENNHLAIIFSHTNYLTHIGGTQKYIYTQINYLMEKNYKIVQIFPKSFSNNLNENKGILYGININSKLIGFFHIKVIMKIIKIIKNNIITAYTHHLLFWKYGDYMKLILNLNKKTKKVYFIHDFFPFIPEFNKIFFEAKSFDNLAYFETSGKIKLNESLTKSNTYYGFKNSMIKIFKVNDHIICPSEFLYNLFQEVYPEFVNKIILQGHLILDRDNENNFKPKYNKKIRIAFLGSLIENKGLGVWKEIYNKDLFNKDYEFFHLGSNDAYSSKVKSIGFSYLERLDIAIKLLKENGIDIVLLWSTIPEGYSYTLYEAIAAGIPALTSKCSGNIAYTINKFKNQNLGRVFDKEEDLFKFLSDKDKVRKFINLPRKRFKIKYNIYT